MKKFCSRLLMVILVFSLAGCGGTRNNDVSKLSEETSNSVSEPLSEITDDSIQPQNGTEDSAESNADTPVNTNTISESNTNTTAFDLGNGTVLLNSGYTMPILGIGCFTRSNNEAENSVYWALRDGYRLIDTARIYGNDVICCEL